VGRVRRRLIAFDLDGTLVDSRQDLANSVNELIAELGGALLTTDAVVSMVGEGAGMLVRRALAASGLGMSDDALARFLAIYDRRLLEHTCLYPGIADVLSAAGTFGDVAVLTNKPSAPTERILTSLGVRDLIGQVVGGDGPYARKPDPAGLLALMRADDADARSTLLVGDSWIDLETARRAGTFCCLVTYGFGRPEEAPAGPRAWVASDAAGILEVLERFRRGGSGTAGPGVDEQL
jgi:phosphoglycolate phosphatase